MIVGWSSANRCHQPGGCGWTSAVFEKVWNSTRSAVGSWVVRNAVQSASASMRRERVPADLLPEVPARVVAELVGKHDPHLAGAEAALQERVPEHHPAARAETHRLGIRQIGELVHVLHVDRD